MLENPENQFGVFEDDKNGGENDKYFWWKKIQTF